MSRPILLSVALTLLLGCTSAAPVAEAPTSPPPAPTSTVAATPAPTPTSTPSPSPSPTARPSRNPSPTAQPTISEEDLAQMFLLIADAYNAGTCAENQILENASDSELFEVATASFARGADDTERFGQDVLDLFVASTANPMLLSTASWIHEASLAVAEAYREIAAAEDIDELFEAYDRRASRDAENNMKSAGSTMRAYLGLPERPDDPCTRET